MKWIYPYRTLFGDISAKITNVMIDGMQVSTSPIDADRREIELADIERSEWNVARVDVELSGPLMDLGRFEDARGIVVFECSHTNTRQTARLQTSGAESNRWWGSVNLDRDSWFGRITMRACITATVDSVSDRVIGLAPEWRLHLDDLPRPSVHGAIPVQWDSFSEPHSTPVLTHYKGEPSFLSLDTGGPILYLNQDFPGLHALLTDTSRRPAAEHAMHDEVRAAIAVQSWMAMFNTSLLAAPVGDDGEAEWPSAEWQRTVLELLLPRMYPERNPLDALREAKTLAADEAGAAAVQQALLPAVSAHVGATRLLGSALRRLGSDGREA